MCTWVDHGLQKLSNIVTILGSVIKKPPSDVPNGDVCSRGGALFCLGGRDKPVSFCLIMDFSATAACTRGEQI